MDIITRIFESLKASGKSQNEFAAYLGVPKSLITHWKAGRINSYTKYMPKIAEFLGVSVDYLLGTEAPGDWDKDIKDFLEALNKNSDMKFFVDYVKGATIEEVKQTIEIAKALHKRKEKE